MTAEGTLSLPLGVRDMPEAEQVELVRSPSISEARDAWAALAERTANIFSSWDWADVWWQHFGEDETLSLTTVHLDEEVVAVLPMHVERRRGLRLLRFVGHGQADQLGPVCDPASQAHALAALTQLMSDGTVLLAERMPVEADWCSRLPGRVLATESSPVIDIGAEGGWEDYLKARSSNFRQQVRRRDRKLTRELDVTYRLCRDPAQLGRDFDTLLALHNARWGSDSSAFEGASEAFHRAFAARALERGWLRLWVAESGGTPVAAWYGFRFGGVESYYQSGRDPAWDQFAVGAGILEHSIREAFSDGMREYRFLRGGEAYKRRYATRDYGLCTVAAARTFAGRVAVSTISLLAGSSRGRKLLKASERLD